LLQRTIEYRTAVTNLCCSAGQLVAGLMELKDGRRGWADMKATTRDNTFTGAGRI
jgi:hypothetical protein